MALMSYTESYTSKMQMQYKRNLKIFNTTVQGKT